MLSRYRFDRETPTPCWPPTPSSTSSRRRRSATSTGCASAWPRTRRAATAYLGRRLHRAALRGLLRQGRGGATSCSTRAPGRRLLGNELQVQPLHSAASGRHHEVCRVLIAAGADVNATQRHELHPAPRGGPARRRRARRAVPARPARTRRRGPMTGDTPADRRGGRPPRRRARLREVATEVAAPSAAFEVPLAVPGVDDRVVGVLLDPGGVEVVVCAEPATAPRPPLPGNRPQRAPCMHSRECTSLDSKVSHSEWWRPAHRDMHHDIWPAGEAGRVGIGGCRPQAAGAGVSAHIQHTAVASLSGCRR